MVTRNIKIVAQGQADATYADQQKKNGFRLSAAILNEEAYHGQSLVRRNIQNAVPVPAAPPEPAEFDLFSPFIFGDWQFNSSSFVGSPSPRIQIMPDPTHPLAPRTSSFYTKSRLDLTRQFFITARFLSKISGDPPLDPPLDGFTVAISASPMAYGGNGGGLGIAGGGNTIPVVGIALQPYSVNETLLLLANTTGTPTGSSLSLGDLGTDITTVDDLVTVVVIGYYPDINMLTYTLSNNKIGSGGVVNTYTNVNLPTLLGVNNGYIGCSAGAGAKIQPVFLTGMSYIQ
jgi:hypothetical protein